MVFFFYPADFILLLNIKDLNINIFIFLVNKTEFSLYNNSFLGKIQVKNQK